MTIHVLRHIDIEGPGYLEEVLERRGLPWRLVKVDAGEAVPATLEGISGLVLLGGPMSVNDELPWIEAELALIRAAARAGLPVLGHCLGGQLIARALGGRVQANPVKEIGWFEVECLAPDRWPGMPRRFPAFHWHGETFSLPPGAVPLFRSEFCPQQGFAAGSLLALQFHLEVLPEMIPQWCRRYQGELAAHAPSASVQSAEEMTRRAATAMAALKPVADRLYGHWLDAVPDSR